MDLKNIKWLYTNYVQKKCYSSWLKVSSAVLTDMSEKIKLGRAKHNKQGFMTKAEVSFREKIKM